jgi:hypothetical protein
MANDEARQKQTITFGEVVRTYLPLAVVALGAAITWGVFSQRLSYFEVRLNTVEQKQEAQRSDFTNLDKNITEIKTILNERLPAKK